MTRVDRVIERILNREGGFVNRAEDRGGPTNFGITMLTLTEERKRLCTLTDIQNLTREEATSIYFGRYCFPFQGIHDDNVFDLAVDTAVNNGRGRAMQWLQRANGLVEDGVLGPISLSAINAGACHSYYGLCAIRMMAYGALVSAHHEQVIFVAGWLNRLAEFVSRGIPSWEA